MAQNGCIDGDRELLRRARGDPEAIGALVARHARNLERFLVELPLLPARAGAPPVFGTLRVIGGDGRELASRRFIAVRDDPYSARIADPSDDS